jgi:hypothetical protein
LRIAFFSFRIFEKSTDFILFADEEIFVNLTEHSNEFFEMTTKLEGFKPAKSIQSEPKFSAGELVLAKYHIEEGSEEFNWCRAVVLKQKPDLNKYDIFYFDYGNYSPDVHSSELVSLPDDFGLDLYRPFAYQISLENIQVDIENQTQAEIIGNFFIENESFMIKVVGSEPSRRNDKILNYFVQIWDTGLKSCLNHLLAPSSPATRRIDQSSISRLLSTSTKPISVESAYTFIESLQNPFYFSTREDKEKRFELDEKLNVVYKSKTSSISQQEIVNARQGDYLAALSEDNWYRTRIVATENNEWTLLYIDYGYEETVNPRLQPDRFHVLGDEFFRIERLAFGCCLVEDPKSNHSKLIEVANNEVSFIISI